MFQHLASKFCYPEALALPTATAPQRPVAVIVHQHLFKHAGSTLDGALRRNFGTRFVEDRVDPRLQGDGARFAETLDVPVPPACLSSHKLRLPLPAVPGYEFHHLILLRHPLERIESVYKFEKRTRGRIGSSGTLAEFVEECLDISTMPAIRNHMVSQLLPSPVNWQRRFDEDDTRIATARLEDMPLVGLVDRFDDSMILFETHLANAFPGLDLSYVAKNVSGQKASMDELERKLQRLKAALGAPLFTRLEAANACDLALYEAGTRLFEQRLAALGDISSKREAFRLRCEWRVRRSRRLSVRLRRKLCEVLKLGIYDV